MNDMKKIIWRLKLRGFHFKKGLSNEEFDKIEKTYNFHFPKEIREFLSYGMPVGDYFHDWRDFSEENIKKIKGFQDSVEEAFLFDFEHNDFANDFKDQFPEAKDEKELAKCVLEYLHKSPKLIPFYSHRCFFDGMDDMPMVSFWQPTDSPICGINFVDFIEREFFNKNRETSKEEDDEIEKRVAKTGIWKDIIF